jgi:hypothetical protein
MCRCIKCSKIFNNDNEYIGHKCDPNLNSEDEKLEIPTNPNGEFCCPICKNRYTDANLLGEHFIIYHNNYTELEQLDNTVIKEGFPGFEVLEELYMIEKLSSYQIKLMIKNRESCPICCLEFKNQDNEYKPTYNNLNNYYNSDDELEYDESHDELEYNKYKRVVCSDSKLYIKKSKKEKRSIINKKLINKINSIKKKLIKPLIMRCCDFILCYNCLELTLSKANNLICPFCRFDHCKHHLKFFTIIEPGYYKSNRWISWWERHLDIFD